MGIASIFHILDLESYNKNYTRLTKHTGLY